MKKNALFFFLVSVLFILALFTNLSAENPLPPGLSDLLSGKITDTQAVLSGFNDVQIPEALTLCEVLKHKALHKEIKLSPEAVDLFKATLETRLKSSEEVSLTKTQTHTQRIPAREIVVEGHKLIISEHFLAPILFAIIDYSPRGEAGTLLPEIQVQFIGGKAPVKAKILLDGKEVPTQGMKNGILYRPILHPESVLAMGEHIVEAVLTDSTQELASASWPFTVGVEPVNSPPIPADAALVSSFTIPIEKFSTFCDPTAKVTVLVRENAEGRRFFEYLLTFNEGNRIRQTSVRDPWSLRKILMMAEKAEESIVIKPQTPHAFPGNVLEFSVTYKGPGVVIDRFWRVRPNGGDEEIIHSAGFSWVMPEYSLQADCVLKIQYPQTEGETPDPITTTVTKDVSTFDKNALETLSPRKQTFSNPPPPIVLSGGRMLLLDGDVGLNLIQGNSVDYHGGIVRAKKAVLGVFGPGKFDDPATFPARLIITGPGVVEVFHDVELSYSIGDENYTGKCKPKVSSLFAYFKSSAKFNYKKVPPGIIAGTTRIVKVDSVALSVNQNSIDIRQPTVVPPLVIGQSQLFPEHRFEVQRATLAFPMPKNTSRSFEVKIYYASDAPITDGKLKITPTVQFLDSVSSLGFASSTEPLVIPAYEFSEDLIDVHATPIGPQIMYDGQTISFMASAITPKPGVGVGGIRPEGGSINFLDGYETTSVNCDWFGAMNPPDDEEKEKLGKNQNWSFEFTPDKGPGSYTVAFLSSLGIKEMETEDESYLWNVVMIPVTVLPNFQITSPPAGFIYPQGTVVDVTTSLDSNPAQWKEIVWTLNQKPWNPGNAEPPHKLPLNDVGTYTLKAEYATGPGQTLSQSVTFFAAPFKTVITPNRRVVSFTGNPTIPVAAKATIGDFAVTEPDEEIPLGNTGLTAKVTKIEWDGVSLPQGAGQIEPGTDAFHPSIKFTAPGALTALATVTVQISKTVKIPATGKTRVISQMFVIPSSRADFWSIPSPGWTQLSGHFPGRGINGTRRTFFPEEGFFTHDQKPFSWNPSSGISPQILMEPALSGVQAVTCQEIGFSWKGPENQASDALEFPVLFSSGSSDQIQCAGYLRFDEGAKVAFPEKAYAVSLQPLEEVVAASVDPATFSTSPGAGKRLTFILQEKGVPPVPAKTLYFWKGEYQADIARVAWSSNGNALGEGNPFDLSIPVKEQQIIKAKGTVSVQEADVKKKPAPATSHTMTAEAQVAVIRIIAYPGPGYVYPARSPFTLKARTDTVDPSQISWKLNDATIGVGPEVQIQGLVAGDYTISATTPEFPGVVETRKIKIFDWSFTLTPNEKVFLWEGKPLLFPITAQAVINGKILTSSTQSAAVEKAKVQVSVPQAFWRADLPDSASVATFSDFIATGTFKTRGRMELLSSSTMEITQPDTLKESFPTDYFSVLMGAIEASATYSFAFEPQQAIVGTQRLFVVGSVSVRLPDTSVVVDRSLPFNFEPPVELVKPLLTDRKPILVTQFDHTLSAGVAEKKEYPEGISMQPVFFSDSSPRKAVWAPFVKTANAQKLSLASTEKALKPFELSELLTTRIAVEKPELLSGEPTKVSFFFGPKNGTIDSQTSVLLFGEDYRVTLKNVEWYSNGKPLSSQGPNIQFSCPEIGKYNVSASATFFIEPKEGEEFGGSGMVEAPPVLVRVIKGLRIKNLKTGSFAAEHKLSYRANTDFAAFLVDEEGNEESVFVTWNLVATSGWEIKKGGKRAEILTSLGIPEAHQFIGHLPASSSTVVNAHKTTFTSSFSGKVNLETTYNGGSAKTTLFLSQPTVYCHFKQVKDFEAGDTKKQIDTWLTEANKLWGQENLIKIKPRNNDPVMVDNFDFGAPEEDTIETELMDPITFLNPITWDDLQNQKYQIDNVRIAVIPRQTRALLQKNRSSSSANVYLVQQPWSNTFQNGFDRSAATTISGNDYVQINATDTPIFDSLESGIISRVRPDFMHEWTLAHELGHLLIQAGDEHTFSNGNEKPLNYLMNRLGTGAYISPEEFLKALDYPREKTFILEEALEHEK